MGNSPTGAGTGAATDAETDRTNREVAEGIYRFGTHRVNWYVVESDEGLTVVDAGFPAHRPQLTEWLDASGYDVDDVAALVLTHADADHVGFARSLADRGVPVYCHPADLDHLRGHPQGAPGWFYRNIWHPGFFLYAVEMVRDGVTSVEAVQDTEPLADGDVLPVPGDPRVLFAPGHTPGSCALYLADRSVLLCGDVLATRNIFTGREGDPQLLGAADDDHEAARRSLSRLAGLGEVTLLPGHGNPWRGDVETALELAR